MWLKLLYTHCFRNVIKPRMQSSSWGIPVAQCPRSSANSWGIILRRSLCFSSHALTTLSLSSAQLTCANVEGPFPVSFHPSSTLMLHFEQTPSASIPWVSARYCDTRTKTRPGIINIYNDNYFLVSNFIPRLIFQPNQNDPFNRFIDFKHVTKIPHDFREKLAGADMIG